MKRRERRRRRVCPSMSNAHWNEWDGKLLHCTKKMVSLCVLLSRSDALQDCKSDRKKEAGIEFIEGFSKWETASKQGLIKSW